MIRSSNLNNINPSRRNFLKTTTAGALGGAALLGAVGNGTQGIQAVAATVDVSSLPRVKQALVAPPFLPEHEQIAAGGPKIVEVILTIEEKKMAIDGDGTEVWAFAYNGSVPGPIIVVHEGDYCPTAPQFSIGKALNRGECQSINRKESGRYSNQKWVASK